jgi:energy-coupling factor transport system substrate-specific component
LTVTRLGKARRNATRELVLLALLTALLVALQVALAAIPNVELVTLLIALYTLHYRHRALLAVYAFVLCEGLLYGFGFWFINYLYVWAALWGLALLLRHIRSPFAWALMLMLYGLCFGLLCAVPYVFVGGVGMAWAYFVSGIPFDIIHGLSNFVVTLVLFAPLDRLFTLANRKLGLTYE